MKVEDAPHGAGPDAKLWSDDLQQWLFEVQVGKDDVLLF